MTVLRTVSALLLPFPGHEWRIDCAAEDALAEIAAMAEAAREHINRSIGQQIRRSRERIEKGV